MKPELGCSPMPSLPIASFPCLVGFTHIEVMPITEHPFDGSWGYQVTGWYAPPAATERPMNSAPSWIAATEGIGVIIDWVPGHFLKDAHGLAFFDGAHLYEHSDPRIGEHKEWAP